MAETLHAARVILRKELLELRRSPVLLASLASLPVTVVAVPLALLAWLGRAAPAAALEFVQELYRVPAASPLEAVALALARNWLPMFLVLPVFLPILIAAQSVGGERERRTLEPLLATPAPTVSIVAGKSLAALAPAVVLSWLAAAAFCGGVDLIVGRLVLPDRDWLVCTLAVAPLFALFGNTLAVVVSTRILDVRAAQNLAATTVVPLLGLLVAQLAGRARVGPAFYPGLAAGALVLDGLLLWLAVRAFDRERLLTNWG